MIIKKNKLKTVLIVSNCTWYLYNFREKLLAELNKKGYKLILISPYDEYHSKIYKYFSKQENLFLVRGSENPILEIITLLQLLLAYIKYRPDLVHHFTIKPCIYGGFIAKFIGIKNTINHITGLGPSFFSSRVKINFLNRIFKPIYKYSFNNKKYNLINIFHNDSDRYSFVKKGITSSEKTKTIMGSGVDTEHFKNIKSKSFNKKVQILFPARIIKEKGIVELIEACNELWNEKYKFTLNIAGEIDKQNRSHLKKNVFETLVDNPNIYFLGKCMNMVEIYKKIDIVVLPSWREGLSKSLLESASMSLPIITTNAPGCNDVITDQFSGIIVPVRDKVKLKIAIKKYLENPKSALNFGKNARKTIVKKFTHKIINKKILEIYDQFLN